MEDENHANKNSGLFESTKYTKERNKHEGMNENRKNKSMDRKYSER